MVVQTACLDQGRRPFDDRRALFPQPDRRHLFPRSFGSDRFCSRDQDDPLRKIRFQEAEAITTESD